MGAQSLGDSGIGPDAMEEDTPNNSTTGTSQASSHSTPQGAPPSQAAPSGHPQGNPTPGSTQSSNTPASAGSHNPQHSKRRRGLGIVTPNACTECRKKRAKCDGQRPCGRCKGQKDIQCVYEIPVRQSKENLRNEIENLRHKQRSSEQVFAALSRPDLWEEVLVRLRNGHTIEGISDWLGGALPLANFTQPPDPRNSMAPVPQFANNDPTTVAAMDVGLDNISPVIGQQSLGGGGHGQNTNWNYAPQSQASSSRRKGSHPDSMNWSPGPDQTRARSWAEGLLPDQLSDSMPKFRGLEHILSPLNEPEIRSPAGTWTNITADVDLVQHLLALYFCWEYPTFASLSKEHFLRDFQAGRHRFCSPILVNALLALGCRFSTQPMTRAVPDNPYTSGDHFFKETQRLFYQETDHHSLTTIQALGIMSIREASCGRDSESWYYAGQSIRLAIEMGLHVPPRDPNDEAELAVRSATFWGAFALDHAWSIATGSLPQCSSFPHLPAKPAIIDDVEASLWVPYTDDGVPLQRSCEQPSNVRSVYKCFCELSELVHQSLYVLHSPGKPLTARDLLGIYTQYLNWYDQIPEVLRLGHNFTPAVLFAHMYYHFAILLLFRPLIKLQIIGSKVLPRDVCSQAADAIQGLLRSYSRLYTLRRTPSFVPYFVLTSAIMHLAIGGSKARANSDLSSAEGVEVAARVDPHVSETIKQGIADLTEMAPCHHFAEQALNILRYLAKKWDIDVGDNDAMIPEEFEGLVKPSTNSLNFFAPNVCEGDFVCEWKRGQDTAQDTMRKAEAVEQKSAAVMGNPLFWPFPMQGRPILPSGKELGEAGFALLP